jgi:signal transduction histidine kinase
VFVRAVGDAQLLELPPLVAVETRLRLLRAFAGIPEASLWTVDGDGATTCVVDVGDGPPARRARVLARAALEGREEEIAGGARALLHALPINRWERPYAALVVKADLSARDGALVLAGEVARTLATALEMEALLARNAERERSLVDSSERRLVRLGFDLHDGPMQDAAALGAEIRHFRDQLDEVLADDDRRTPLVGRVDDLEARLRALDADLRAIANSLNTPVALRVPFRDVLNRELATFERRTGIDATLKISGNFDRLSTSQRIALLRLVQEALANVQNHSQASQVAIQLTAARTHVHATVEDNGVGFDVEETLVAAARRGRLGLVGMGERIRLLGGRLDVVSRPGARTTIRATIPAWRPPETTSSAP